MAREYIVGTLNATTTGAVDLAQVFINPSATIGNACGLEFLRCWASQAANATSAQQSVAIRTQVTAFPTLTAATPRKCKFLDPASLIVSGTSGAAGSAGVVASVAGAGAKAEVVDDNFNVLNGWLWVPTPAETIVMPAMAASGIGLYFPVQAGTLTSWSFGMTYRELG